MLQTNNMKLCKIQIPAGTITAGIVGDETVTPLAGADGPCQLSELLEADDIPAKIGQQRATESLPLGEVRLLPPIDNQEVWAAGVTYKRSQTARMEEWFRLFSLTQLSPLLIGLILPWLISSSTSWL